METIYQVTTEGDVEGRSIRNLGYATGNPADIKAFFDDKKFYTINVRELDVITITPELTRERYDLMRRKKEIEQELERIKAQLE